MGVFGPIRVDPANLLTPENAIRLGGTGVIGHEYAHMLFFNRHQYSTEEYVNTLDYAATEGTIVGLLNSDLTRGPYCQYG